SSAKIERQEGTYAWPKYITRAGPVGRNDPISPAQTRVRRGLAGPACPPGGAMRASLPRLRISVTRVTTNEACDPTDMTPEGSSGAARSRSRRSPWASSTAAPPTTTVLPPGRGGAARRRRARRLPPRRREAPAPAAPPRARRREVLAPAAPPRARRPEALAP